MTKFDFCNRRNRRNICHVIEIGISKISRAHFLGQFSTGSRVVTSIFAQSRLPFGILAGRTLYALSQRSDRSDALYYFLHSGRPTRRGAYPYGVHSTCNMYQSRKAYGTPKSEGTKGFNFRDDRRDPSSSFRSSIVYKNQRASKRSHIGKV